MDVQIVSGEQWPDAVARLLRDLPEWFGLEQSVQDYVAEARFLPSTAALRSDEVVGICLVRRHTPAAEIELLAVDRSLHRQGIGRRLVQAIEIDLRESGVQLLQVKTFGPSGNSEEYERPARSTSRLASCRSRSGGGHLGSAESLSDLGQAAAMNSRPFTQA